jgi:NAD(P)-dependent dehydrogenase (short-subunit alcohol dehydrogenase family)
MTTSSPHVAVVTGANSGIGRATALHLAQQGYRVFGTVRSLDKAGKLQARANELGVSVELIELDVADDASVQRGFADIFRTTDQVDVLVNNAGIGGNGVVEESTSQMYHDAFNVNVVGAIRCTQQVLPKMRAQRSGTIVNITSVVGKFAALAQAPYVASKWAFEGLSEELAQEVAPFGIRVVIIEPGVTKSSIFAKNIDAPNQTGAYDAHYRRMFAFYAAGIANATPAEEVGALIHHAITTDSPQLRYACSWGGPEIVAGRARQTDSDWVAMAATDDDSDYFAAFRSVYGVDLGKS